MKIAVFSDLHLAPGRLNRCTASAQALLEFFDHVHAMADRVVVAGDLFDLDRPHTPGSWCEHLRQITREFPDLMARLGEFDWVWGNHDAPLARRGVPEERVLVADGLRVLIRHGHQWDMPLKRVPGLAAGANFAAGWLQRARLGRWADRLGEVPRWLDAGVSAGGGERGDRWVQGAHHLLEQGDWDVVVCGHTHRLRLCAGAHGLFVNTGALCLGHLDFVLIDTRPAQAQAQVTAYRDFVPRERLALHAGQWRAVELPGR